QNQLHVVAASTARGGVRIQRAVVLPVDLPPTAEGAEAVGKSLRERLKNARIAPAPVLACVGRGGVIVRELRHPPVPADDGPNLIRFQVSKELTEAGDDVVIDYTPLPGNAPGGERRALAVVVRRPVLAAYKGLCNSAGLKLVALTPRPFGLAGCLQR